VLRRGRAVRGRRRSAVATGLVVLGVGVALLSYQQVRHPAPAAPSPRAVTVAAPHRNAHGDLVLSGTVNGRPWSATVDPSTGCVPSFGSCPGNFPAPVDPLSLSSTSDSVGPDNYIGTLRSDTARVEVVLRDGEHVSLLPVDVKGRRVVLFATPHAFGMDSITAFAPDGTEIGYSIPFNQPNGMSMAVTWYLPGETPTQPRASGQVASGTVDGHSWSVDVMIGPFGVCFLSSETGSGTNVACSRLDAPAPMSPSSSSGSVGGLTWHYSAVDSRIGHIDVALSDGTTTRVTPTRMAGWSLATYVVAPNVRVVSTTSYDSEGHQLAKEDGDTAPK
jgi:hypothetical protein